MTQIKYYKLFSQEPMKLSTSYDARLYINQKYFHQDIQFQEISACTESLYYIHNTSNATMFGESSSGRTIFTCTQSDLQRADIAFQHY